MGELVDGHGCLADKHQIAGQAAYIGEAFHGHIPPQGGHDGVVDVGDTHHRRNHSGGVSLGAGARLPKGLVFLPETVDVLLLMVEDLYHLLSCRHFLNISVQIPQSGLLFAVVRLAPLSAETDIEEHGHIAHHYHQCEPPVEDEEYGEGSHHLNKTLDHHGEAVVELVGDGVYIVGEIAHHVAVPAGIKEPDRQSLEMGEEVPADVEKDLLSRLDHGLGIPEGGQRAEQVDAGGERHASEKGLSSSADQVIDHGADHVGTQQICQRADGDQHRHCQKQVFVPPHVRQKGAQSISQVLRLLGAELTGCHGLSLLSSGIHRSPDRWGQMPAAPGECQPRGSFHPRG